MSSVGSGFWHLFPIQAVELGLHLTHTPSLVDTYQKLVAFQIQSASRTVEIPRKMCTRLEICRHDRWILSDSTN
jgi:hypothetical protein